MTPDKQTIFAGTARTVAFAAVFAVQTILAVHSAARAQAPGLVVAPGSTPVAASAAGIAATPAVAIPAARPLPFDATKHVAIQPSASPVPAPPVSCTAPAELVQFDRPLLHTMRRLASGEPLTIVAIGSSSTAGAGASSPAASYPSQLAADLRQRFPGHDITVLNRGVNGEETNDMMARFATGVFPEHPQLVLWQVGTNSVLRDRPLGTHSTRLHEGIDELKSAHADVVLMDPQFAPAVIAKPETPDMVAQLAVTAKEENVDLFRRFAVMRNWYEVGHRSFAEFVSPDQLHMNDWSYACIAKLLGVAIAEAAVRPVASAAVHATRPAN